MDDYDNILFVAKLKEEIDYVKQTGISRKWYWRNIIEIISDNEYIGWKVSKEDDETNNIIGFWYKNDNSKSISNAIIRDLRNLEKQNLSFDELLAEGKTFKQINQIMKARNKL